MCLIVTGAAAPKRGRGSKEEQCLWPKSRILVADFGLFSKDVSGV
jgi:hypothetical protein